MFKPLLSWLLAIIVAGILLQTLYFKFSGHPESVAIFQKLGVEPWGRWLSGILELLSGILILVPKTRPVGAFIALGIMSGAILAHLTVIGIASNDDGGQLFLLACITWLGSLILSFPLLKQIVKPFISKS